MSSETATVADILVQLGLDADPFQAAERSGRWWHFDALGLKIPCYNFSWRKKALPFHDLHHAVTGYPCSMRGEMQVATWEFAAGRFPNLCSNLFCLPLVAAGVCFIPIKTFAAFRSGRRSTSLFGKFLGLSAGGMPVSVLRSVALDQRVANSIALDLLSFVGLAALSAIFILMPVAIVMAATGF